ncbi:MAG: hypothetical protein ACLT9P_10490 [Evtepia gabavorous]
MRNRILVACVGVPVILVVLYVLPAPFTPALIAVLSAGGHLWGPPCHWHEPPPPSRPVHRHRGPGHPLLGLLWGAPPVGPAGAAGLPAGGLSGGLRQPSAGEDGPGGCGLLLCLCHLLLPVLRGAGGGSGAADQLHLHCHILIPFVVLDAGAMLVGMFPGQTSPHPHLSPKETVEGSVGEPGGGGGHRHPVPGWSSTLLPR